MMNAKGRPRPVLGAALGAVSLVVAVPAMADTELQWRRQFGTTETEYSHGVATDPAGNVYLTGKTVSEADDAIDYVWAWVAKYDATGHALWKRQLGTVEPDEARGVATDAAGNVYLTGSTRGSFAGPNRGGSDAWLMKYDAGGQMLWKRQLGSKGSDDAFGVATDTLGNIYLTGETYGSLGGPRHGHHDAWVAKYDASGHLLWKRQFGTAEWERATGVATDAAGNAYIGGWTRGSLAGPIRGSTDAWVAKYDAAGHLLWTHQFGTGMSDHAEGVATDAAGNLYLTGYTDSWFSSRVNAWVAKYDAAGHALWTQRLGTEAGSYAFGVAGPMPRAASTSPDIPVARSAAPTADGAMPGWRSTTATDGCCGSGSWDRRISTPLSTRRPTPRAMCT